MNKILNVSVAALTVAGSVLATAAPVAAQGRAMGGGHAMATSVSGAGHGVVSGPRVGGDRDGGWRGGGWRGGWGGWRGGYPYRYGYGYGWGPAFAGLAIGAAIGSAYAYGPGYYSPYGACRVWSPYYGRYVVRAC